MWNAECGMPRRVRAPGVCGRPDRRAINPASRTPHSAFVSVRKSEDRMASEARPRDAGRFGPYGGRYVPETLMAALEELDRVHEAAKRDSSFWTELNTLLHDHASRPP